MTKFNGEFHPITVKSKTIKGLSVQLHWDCYEGWNGEYDQDDPDDSPLLRFDVNFNDEEMDDGSYCTQLKATDKRSLLVKATKVILSRAEDTFNTGIKRAMEEMSWLKIENNTLK